MLASWRYTVAILRSEHPQILQKLYPVLAVALALRVFGAALEIEDSGSGNSAAERRRVFTPFYRAAAAQEANPGGSGLGLAIVQDIAVLHGAQLELSDSAGGQGLNIIVRFPPAAGPEDK
ncbi:MAG: ATP-binding protein [Oxalobacteraceae bacterium]